MTFDCLLVSPVPDTVLPVRLSDDISMIVNQYTDYIEYTVYIEYGLNDYFIVHSKISQYTFSTNDCFTKLHPVN